MGRFVFLVIRAREELTMDSSNDQNNKEKNIWLSILAGIGCAVGGFVVGTIITSIIVYMYFNRGSSNCYDSCFFGIVVFSPIVGLVTALIVGFFGGRRTYKRFSEKQ
jgi:amino acid permease